MKPLPLLVLVWSAVLLPVGADPARDFAEEVAQAHGLSHWSRVQAVKFTFHVQLPDKSLQRTWEWKPKSGEVTQFENGSAVLSWKRSELSQASPAVKTADGQFINDSYWLLYPFRMVWDGGAQLSLDPVEQPLPIGRGKGRKLTVTYTGGDGYTPGDAYDIYVGSDRRVAAWVFRKGNAPQPTRLTTWEDYQTMGGLVISLNRPGPEGFRIWFTDVAVQTVP